MQLIRNISISATAAFLLISQLFAIPPDDENKNSSASKKIMTLTSEVDNGTLSTLPKDVFGEILSFCDGKSLCHIMLTQKFPKQHREVLKEKFGRALLIKSVKNFYQKLFFSPAPEILIPDNLKANQLEGFVLKKLFETKSTDSTYHIATYKYVVIKLFEKLPLEGISMKLLDSMPGLLKIDSNLTSSLIDHIILGYDTGEIATFIKDVPVDKISEHFGNLDAIYYPPVRFDSVRIGHLPIKDLGKTMLDAQNNGWDMFTFFSLIKDLRDQHVKGSRNCSYGIASEMFQALKELQYNQEFVPNREKIEKIVVNHHFFSQKNLSDKVKGSLSNH